MSQSISPLIIRNDCETVSKALTENLRDADYQVMRSFDLQHARKAHLECLCPHHGNAQCDCQMVVLLIYLPNGEPHTLLAHGRDGVTYLGWDEKISEDEEEKLFSIIQNLSLEEAQKREMVTA